ncbi:MAG: DUF4124 domain-containing protein [Gammaproteobacteria bacterium]|jgi:hypothetical protein
MKFSAYLLVLLAATAQAEVYKSTNADGEVIYSDVPTLGAKRMQMPELPTYTPAPLPVATAAPADATPAVDAGYSTMALDKPRNEESIRSNAGILNVAVSLEPELQSDSGHRVQFFLDGEPQGKPVARLSTSFLNVDRGTHTVSAAVIDADGASLITSAPVRIHLQRTSILQPKNPLNPARQGTAGNSGGASGSAGSGSTSGSTGGAAPAQGL